MRFSLFKLTVLHRLEQQTHFVIAPDEERARDVALQMVLTIDYDGYSIEAIDDADLPDRRGLDELLTSAPVGVASCSPDAGWSVNPLPMRKLTLFRAEQEGHARRRAWQCRLPVQHQPRSGLVEPGRNCHCGGMALRKDPAIRSGGCRTPSSGGGDMSVLRDDAQTARCRFAATEQAAQADYYACEFAGLRKHPKHAFILAGDDRLNGLQPLIRETTKTLFEDKLGIQFHTFVGHGRSSQACCLNFLMPFADKPEALSKWVSHVLGIDPPTMLEIEEPAAGAHRYVAFEYTGPDKKDFLDECNGRAPGRGANATAADAAVAFVDASGKRTLLLIEWKYTEEYLKHQLRGGQASNDKRKASYQDKLFAPQGPLRTDKGLVIDDILHEPFYQLARQQMLGWQIVERSKGCELTTRFDAALNLHLSPSGNKALHHVTSPGFARLAADAFDAFRESLVHEKHFREAAIEDAFAPLADWPELAESWTYLRNRYPSLCPAKDPA